MDNNENMINAVDELLCRCLYHSASFLIDLIPKDANISTNSLEVLVYKKIKTLFDLKEYKRCYSEMRFLLKKSPITLPDECVFIGYYARFIYLKKQSVEDIFVEKTDVSTEIEKDKMKEKILIDMQNLLAEFKNTSDPYLLYLKAEIHFSCDEKEEAQDAAILSLSKAPYNWTCWKIIQTREAIPSGLNDSLLKYFSIIKLNIEQEILPAETTKIISTLERILGKCYFLEDKKAHLLYNCQEYERSKQMYRRITDIYPDRLDHFVTYSTIYYIENNLKDLTLLAHRASEIDKYRPEACAVIANYYSLKGKNEDSVLYFRRALKLDPSFIYVWTMMGHEYTQMGNISGAIMCYRNSVDNDPKDYRAWYGLGQAYESLHLPAYAIRYYRLALSIKEDPRIKTAIEDCIKMCQ
eukprot:GHVP01035188.1.p1 GENE.GHVP01035188.1~~GHVP01035188.1.p1  ORF type:complete len:410 (-),score=65.05 GHVP01035188.1:1376-2605(-)